MRNSGSRKKRLLSIDEIDELMEIADSDKLRQILQTIREEKQRDESSGTFSSRRRNFLSVALYNNSVAVIFVLTLLSFSIWFLLKYAHIRIPVDVTQPALVVVFGFSAIMFHRYVTDREEIVGIVDELAGYSIENESIFENIGSGLIVVDAAGKITKINSKAEAILETRNSDWVGKDCQGISTNPKLGGLMLQTLKTGRPEINRDIELETRAGRHYSLQLTTSLLKNKKGHTIGAVGVMNDVTEIRNLQEKLKLNEHLASIGALSAKLGHEIGNSLGGIKLFADNLVDELSPDDHRREYAEEILAEIDRLKTIVTQLKDYSRPIMLDLRKTTVNEIVESVLSLSKDRIQENGIIVKKRLEQDMPEIMLDTDQISGALLNIVINAIQAMPQGGTITISTFLHNGSVGISIADTGTGIPEENHSRIFNPFFTTKRTFGTGLGLPIAYKAIKLHGGTITYDSEEGVGTTFTIELPIRAEQTEYSEASDDHSFAGLVRT